jgi:hypothetical protein
MGGKKPRWRWYFETTAHVAGSESKPRGEISEARYATSMQGQEAFEREVSAVLHAEGAKSAGAVVWLGDGALANWSLADRQVPGCNQILDWSHAVEHGVALGRAVLGEESALLPCWKERIETLLFAGNNNALVSELMECLATCDENGQWLLPDEAVETAQRRDSVLPEQREEDALPRVPRGRLAHRQWPRRERASARTPSANEAGRPTLGTRQGEPHGAFARRLPDQPRALLRGHSRRPLAHANGAYHQAACHHPSTGLESLTSVLKWIVHPPSTTIDDRIAPKKSVG